jgi:hypothetical protein
VWPLDVLVCHSGGCSDPLTPHNLQKIRHILTCFVHTLSSFSFPDLYDVPVPQEIDNVLQEAPNRRHDHKVCKETSEGGVPCQSFLARMIRKQASEASR